jgi:PIN domain nuclease of toxin-antitoxin system
MSNYILDASALLAVLHQEPGSEEVATLLTQAAMSSVNLSEVIAKLAAVGLSETEIGRATDGLGIAVIPFDRSQAYQAGLLRKSTRSLGLSLGERTCSRIGPVPQLACYNG